MMKKRRCNMTLAKRKDFEQAIKANPLDMTTRKVFADWLDEFTDEAELATFHREMTSSKYLAAMSLIEEFAEELEQPFNRVVELGLDHIKGGNDWLRLPFDTPDIVYMRKQEFWEALHVITGVKIPPNFDDERLPISCGC